jgi:hypothetical protein
MVDCVGYAENRRLGRLFREEIQSQRLSRILGRNHSSGALAVRGSQLGVRKFSVCRRCRRMPRNSHVNHSLRVG